MIKSFRHILFCTSLLLKFYVLGQFHHFGLPLDIQGDIHVFTDFNSKSSFGMWNGTTMFLKGDLIHDEDSSTFIGFNLTEGITPKGTVIFNNNSTVQNLNVSLNTTLNSVDNQNPFGLNLTNANSNFGNIELWQDFILNNSNVVLDSVNLELRYYFIDTVPRVRNHGRILGESNSSYIKSTLNEKIYLEAPTALTSINDDGRHPNDFNLGFTINHSQFYPNSIEYSRYNTYIPEVSDTSIDRYFVISEPVELNSPTITFQNGIIRSFDSDSLDIFVSDNYGTTWSQVGSNKSGSNEYTDNNNFEWQPILGAPYNQSIITLAEKNCDVLPVVNLLKDSTAICSGNSALVEFDSISPGCAVEWFKDGVFSTALTPSNGQSFPDPEINVVQEGWYLITIRDARGCTNMDSIKVNSSDLPEFDAGNCFNINSPCEGDPLLFSANPKPSDSAGMTYNWDFDFYNNNGIYTSTLKNPSFNYSQSGQYSVQLTITDSAGCSSSCIRNAVVYPYPNVDFNFQNTCQGNTVNFNNNSSTTFGSLTYEWNFPSTTYSSQNPSHLFSDSGSFNIELIVGVQGLCYDTLQKVIQIYPIPNADFTFNDTCENDTVFYYSISDVSTPSFIDNYQWNFSNVSNSSSDSTYYVYSNSGTYNTSLIVETNFGCVDTIEKSITIFPSPDVDFTMQNQSSLVYSTSYCKDDTIRFIPNNLINSSWDFGNSNSSNDTITSISYSNYGNYTVSLSQTSVNGCRSTESKDIIINPMPQAITNNPANQCDGIPVNFNSLSVVENNNSIIQHSWNFDYPSAATALGQNPSPYIYPDTGQKIIQLTVQSNNNCVSTILDTVYIYPNPTIDFGNDSISTCGSSYQLDAPANCTYFWSNGTYADSLIVNYSGTFSLKATDQNGCYSRDTVYIELNSIFNPSIQSSSACDSSILDCGSTNATVYWFDSNNDTIGNSRYLTIYSSDTFKVEVRDQNNCIGVDSNFFNIYDSPVNLPSFSNLVTPCYGLSAMTDSLPYDVDYMYSWNPPVSPVNGNQPNRISVDSASIISVIVLDTITNCSLENIITVTPQLNPELDLQLINNLPNDSVASCDSLALISAFGASSYLWTEISNSINLGTDSSISIFSSGYYKCQVFYSSCSNSDSIYVENYEAPIFNLFNGISDTLLCSYDTLVTDDLSLYGSTFNWSNGDSTSFLNITSAGNYIVTVGDSLSQNSFIPGVQSGFCTSEDTILVDFRPILTVDLGQDLFKCNGSDIELIANVNQYPINNYIWNHNGTQLINNDSSLIITDTGNYFIRIVDDYNCIAEDSIKVSPTNQELFAQFLSKTKVGNGDSVKFINLSYPEPFSSSWLIDGIVYDSISPIHTFFNTGTDSIIVSAKLTVQNSACIASEEKLIEVGFMKKSKPILNPEDAVFTDIDFALFPNPNDGNFILDFRVNNDYRVESYLGIFDIAGKSIYNQKIYIENNLQKQFNYDFLPRGVYIVTLYSGISLKTVKFIKI